MTNNPWALVLKLQQTAIENAVHAAQMMVTFNLHLWEQQQHYFFAHHVTRRHEDAHVHEKPYPCGPVLADHYGRRSHDVDVERI